MTEKEAISALEKQIPKKPKHEGCYDAEGVWHNRVGTIRINACGHCVRRTDKVTC